MARPKGRLTKTEAERLAAFRYALRRFLRFSEDQAVAEGLTPQQHQALLMVEGMPGRDFATMGELAERLQLKPHTVVGLVDRLEREELLTRERSAEDGRGVVVRVTAEGRRKVAAVSGANQDELRRLGPDLQAALAAVIGGEERGA